MNVEKKKILLVQGEFPYPPNHGGRIDMWERLRVLYEMGHVVDLVVTVKTMPLENELLMVRQYIRKLYIVNRMNKIVRVLQQEPLQMTSRNELLNIKLCEKYQYVFLDGPYVFNILKNATLNYEFSILRMNNDETTYFYSLYKSAKSIFKKIYYYMESNKFKRIEKEMMEKSDCVAFVSHDEKDKFEKIYRLKRSFFLPAAIEYKFITRPLKSKNVLFIGSFFMVNNQEAIKFYIEKIHADLTGVDGYSFIVAGNSKGEGIEWLYKLKKGYKNIEIYDSPSDLNSLYEKCSVFVNPMLHGAGVKLKTIEAIINGLPVVSTSIGNEGTGLKKDIHLIVRDNPKEWVESIKFLLNSYEERIKFVNSSQNFVKENYNQKEILKNILF